MSTSLIGRCRSLRQQRDSIREERRAQRDRQSKIAIPDSYLDYFRALVWPVTNPRREFYDAWFYGYMGEIAEAWLSREIQKAVVNIRPRCAKSLFFTVGLPTYAWLRAPYLRFMCLSYSQPLATNHSNLRRKCIQDSLYQRMASGGCILSTSKNRLTEFENNSGGHMIARGLEASVTGEGGDFLLFDDPNNPEKVESDTIRASVNQKCKDYSIGRRDDPKKTGVMVVQQRTHEEDWTGTIIAEKLGYELFKLPTVAPVRVEIVWPRSKKVTVREPGELLDADRFGPEQVQEAKATLGSYLWAGRHQQEPAPAGGGLFKDHHWRFWQPAESDLPPVPLRKPDGTTVQVEAVPLPSDLYNQCQSWDCTFKDEKTSDFVAGHVWAHRRPDSFLLDRYHERADIISTIAQIQAFDLQYPRATLKLIEDKANGPAVIQLLQSKVAGLKAVNPQGGKFARAVSAQPSVESGHTYLPHPAIAPWVWDFIGEHSKFPNGKNDDDVDAHTQFKVNFTIGIVRSRSGTVGYG